MPTKSPSPSSPRSPQVKQIAAEVSRLRKSIADEVGRVVIGMGDVVDRFLVSLLAGGHVLFEGVPGTAKTTLVNTVSTVLGIECTRLQFTPDLLPSDVTGTLIFDRNQNEFVLKKGPIFSQILLVDEINRSPAKTQSALLEAMQERQVTIEGQTLPLPKPFLVLATQNPIEQEGVYRLPEAQLDRFLMRIPFRYPDRSDEVRVLEVHSRPAPTPRALLDPEKILELQRSVEGVHVEDLIREYAVDIARRTRDHRDVLLGASPRAALSLLLAGRAHALLSGQPYTSHDDIKAVAMVVLGHRLILRPEALIEGREPENVVREILETLPILHPKK